MVLRQKLDWIKASTVVITVLLSSLIFAPPAAAAEGETWNTRTFPESLSSPRVYFGGGLFILNDNFSNYFYTSADGINWTQRPVSAEFKEMYDFAYGNGIYVATGNNTLNNYKMFYSTNGFDWQSTNTVPGWGAQWVVTFGDNKFVAAKGGNCGTNCISYSSDGINWTLATTPSLGSGPIINFTDIVYTGSTFYAVSGGGAVITSTNGISWTYQTTISGISTWTDYVNELAFGNSTVVGVGPNGRISTSTSPATWTKRTGSPSGNINLTDIAFGQSNFVAVSGEGNIMRSSDGITWSNSGSYNVANSASALLTIAYGNGTFVTFGQGNSYFTSGNTSPSAPTSLTATAGDGQVSISFTAGSDGGSAITNYKYSLDGTTYTALSPVDTTSPISIAGLTNGTAYSIYLKAVNAIGDGTASSSVSVTPSTTPAAPTSLVATAGDGQASISFTAGANGGSAITNYKYSLDGISYTALSPVDTSSPVIITGLSNGTSYSIYLKAVNANGDGTASSSVSVTPSTNPSAPTSLVATAGDGQASISFTAGANGGSAITNYKYSLDGTSYTALSPAVSTSPVTISGLTNATTYSIYLKAVNTIGESSASASVSVTPIATPVVSGGGSGPADYFEPIKEVVLAKEKISWEPNSKVVISKYDSKTKKTTLIENTSGQFVFPKASPGYSVSYSVMATDGTVLKTLIVKSKPTVPKIAKAFAQKSAILTTNKKIAINAQWKKDSSHNKYLVKITLDNGRSITATTTDPNFSIITDETKGATLTITAVGKNNLTATVTRKI